jgi:hypothetical protein
MYGSISKPYLTGKGTVAQSLLRFSKNSCYERPYVLIGDIVGAGLKQRPKSNNVMDRITGTWEVGNV